jgi:uncharacterized protein YraI
MSLKSQTFLAAALFAATSLPALADSVWVQSDSVNILGGKGSIYPTLGTAKKGTELQVVSRDGKWVQVQSGGTTGWVYESALSSQKVNGDAFGNLNIGPAGVNTAAAARGLDPSTEQYAATKGMSRAPLEHLIALKKQVAPPEFEAFVKAVQTNTASPIAPVQPTMAPSQQMVPQQPSYTPQQPAYTPQQQQQPAYRPPQQPAYTPQQPNYTPQQPVYTPQQPH